MDGSCRVDGCTNALLCRGFCRSHYEKKRRSGELELLPRASPAERLATGLAQRPNGCIEWTKATDEKGYGVTRADGRSIDAHRLAWILANGPIPAGLCVLHRCDNPPCCNVEHLFLGTIADNNADMMAKGRGRQGQYQLAKTHCPSGHEYAGENLFIRRDGKRSCRACMRAQWRRADQKRKDTRAALRATRTQSPE